MIIIEPTRQRHKPFGERISLEERESASNVCAGIPKALSIRIAISGVA
jgi:hypothetical protein